MDATLIHLGIDNTCTYKALDNPVVLVGQKTIKIRNTNG